MKKLMIFLVAFTFILSNGLYVRGSELKFTQSNLLASADQVKVGQTVNLTAKTLKQGSGYIEEWNGAQLSKSYFDESTDYYVSESIFTPNQPGTYTITYTVRMYTGNSEVKFISSISKTVEVISDVKEVIGLEVRNVNAYPNTSTDGTLRGYSVLGELFVLWNDNTSTSNETVAYFFLPNEQSRLVNMSVSINNKEYTFPVMISINQ
jgi:hypothetical protein